MLETRFVPRLDRTVTRLGLGALPMGPLQRTIERVDYLKTNEETK